jgi:hypothetical protein
MGKNDLLHSTNPCLSALKPLPVRGFFLEEKAIAELWNRVGQTSVGHLKALVPVFPTLTEAKFHKIVMHIDEQAK